MWFTNGVLLNPGTDAVLADTDTTLAPGSHTWRVFVASTVTVTVYVEHINNSVPLQSQSQAMIIAANVLQGVVTMPTISLGAGDHLRLRVASGVTGSVQGSIFVDA